MHIKSCNKNSTFISIEMERNDLYFMINCLQLGMQNIPMNNEDKTRLISFLNELKNSLEDDNIET